MVRTIGNPLSWGASALLSAGAHAADATEHMGGREDERPVACDLATDDLHEALRAGLDDFTALRSDVMFICLLYPFIGLVLAWAALDTALLPQLFPLASGFALVGPVAALGLYEMSRRREAAGTARWSDAFKVLQAPALAPILAMAVYLVGIYAVWLVAATGLHAITLGPEPPASASAFAEDVFTTAAGWTMIVIGTAVGALFAALVLVVSLVSFPMLLDRKVGLPTAVVTSVAVARRNPRVVATWGAIVAGSLALGTVPLFLGLIFALPILGHATWHLYRRAVRFEPVEETGAQAG